jgi:photosystem II stability/assembly factor-like uncharacterized protein
MKTIRLFAIVALLFSGLLPAQNGWVQQNSGTSNWLNAVHFIDSLTGWACGDNYTIRKTTDGGQNWFSQSFGQGGDWSDIFFVDANTGWLAGKQGQIYRSTDGGNNWFIQHLSTAWSSIFFADAQTGWAVGYNGWISATTDGGDTWTSQSAPGNMYLNDVYFVDRNNGWAVGNGTTVIYTSDGGNNWFAASDSDLYCDMNAVMFTDPDSGFVAGDCSIWSSTNGGTSNGWTDKWTDGYAGDIMAVHFLNGRKGWFAGTQGKIWMTEDGGDSWTEQPNGYSSTFMDITFTDENHGWAVGWGGAIYSTTTGGMVSRAEQFEQDIEFSLSPNPAKDRVVLSISLARAESLELSVHDLTGRKLRTRNLGYFAPGNHQIEWASELPAGLWMVQLRSESGKSALVRMLRH